MATRTEAGNLSQITLQDFSQLRDWKGKKDFCIDGVLPNTLEFLN